MVKIETSKVFVSKIKKPTSGYTSRRSLTVIDKMSKSLSFVQRSLAEPQHEPKYVRLSVKLLRLTHVDVLVNNWLGYVAQIERLHYVDVKTKAKKYETYRYLYLSG